MSLLGTLVWDSLWWVFWKVPPTLAQAILKTLLRRHQGRKWHLSLKKQPVTNHSKSQVFTKFPLKYNCVRHFGLFPEKCSPRFLLPKIVAIPFQHSFHNHLLLATLLPADIMRLSHVQPAPHDQNAFGEHTRFPGTRQSRWLGLFHLIHAERDVPISDLKMFLRDWTSCPGTH